jgi:hypothetical protein
MAAKGFWAGWVAFAGFLMLIIGTLDSLQGLTALIKDEYYVLAPNRILVFDLTTWGWIMLIWGIVLASPVSACSPGRAGRAGSRSWPSAPTSSPSSASWAGRTSRSGASRSSPSTRSCSTP